MKNSKFILLTSALLALALSSCTVKPNRPSEPNIPSEESTESKESSEESIESVDNSVKGIYLNYDSATIDVGKSITLKASIEPSNAINKNVTWSSSDDDVATVTDLGKVTGVKEGTATITATTEDGGLTATCEVSVTEPTEDSYVPEEDENIFSITSEILTDEYLNKDGAYEYTVDKNYKQIYVNAPEESIVINLSGVTIENDENSPIYVLDCDSVEISAKNKTTNYVLDTRSIYTEDVEDQGKGAIYVSNGDLTLKGKGRLDISANYYNGVHGKDDVKVKNLTLDITAVNHGIKGNDSVSISSGNINILCGGDGLHTENSDVSSKGKQRGDINITGGTLTINAWKDAIQASHDVVIDEADSETPTSLTLATNKYSSYEGEVIEASDKSFYLKMSSSTYSTGNYTYAALINDQWYVASYKGKVSPQQGPGPGGNSSYYVYEIERPASARTFVLYRYEGLHVDPANTTTYNAKSDVKSFNEAYDMVQISVRSGKIEFSSWSNYSSKGESAKGLKAENEIYVKAGTLNIQAYDDAIHANNDGELENGSEPLGNVNISGGTINVSSDDDAIHADYTLNISGGDINVKTAYEGLEGNIINISGGNIFVFATDDGINASSGKANTPSITVSGGFVDVTVPSNGDTDGIDSNGTFTLNGGVVIVKGPGNAGGNTFGAAALDSDGAVTLTSGTLIVFGGIERTPSTSLTRTLCSSSTVNVGDHTVSFTSSDVTYGTTLKYSTNGCVVYSELGSAKLN